MTRFQRFSDERSEAGETLLELLISSSLMAVVVVTIVGAIGTMLLGSRVHRDHADANATLVAAAERVKSTDVARVACATTTEASYLTAARSALPAGWSASLLQIDSISYETMSLVGGVQTVSFASTCDTTDTLPLQLVTLKLTSPDGRVSPTLSFIKGDN